MYSAATVADAFHGEGGDRLINCLCVYFSFSWFFISCLFGVVILSQHVAGTGVSAVFFYYRMMQISPTFKYGIFDVCWCRKVPFTFVFSIPHKRFVPPLPLGGSRSFRKRLVLRRSNCHPFRSLRHGGSPQAVQRSPVGLIGKEELPLQSMEGVPTESTGIPVADAARLMA